MIKELELEGKLVNVFIPDDIDVELKDTHIEEITDQLYDDYLSGSIYCEGSINEVYSLKWEVC